MTMGKLHVLSLALICTLGSAVAETLHEAGRDHGQGLDHFDVTPPSSVKDAWALIGAKFAEAKLELAHHNLASVHRASEHIESAVHVMTEKADAQHSAVLISALGELDQSVVALHRAAEHGQPLAAASKLEELRIHLRSIEALYPSGGLTKEK